MMHVSKEIFLDSPVVNAIFFLSLALICSLVARFVPRFPAVRVIVLLLGFLSFYDWLTLTNRLYHRACLLLALGAAVAFARWCGSGKGAFLQFGAGTAPWMVGLGTSVRRNPGGQRLHERSAVAELPPAASGAPNVLVIVVDTLRADHVSSYGYARPTTPNLDRIAQQGTCFENAVSTTFVESPFTCFAADRTLPVRARGRKCAAGAWFGMGNKGLGGFPPWERRWNRRDIVRARSQPIAPTLPRV